VEILMLILIFILSTALLGGFMLGTWWLFLIITKREKAPRLERFLAEKKFKMAYLGILVGIVFIGIGAYQVWKPNRIVVDAKVMWTATGITVKAGQVIDLEVSGQVTASTNPNDAANKLVGPEGWGYDPQKDWTYNGSPTDCGLAHQNAFTKLRRSPTFTPGFSFFN
jgi:hypothetical protein